MADLAEFQPDPDLLIVLKECTKSYGVGSPEAEWPNNILSQKTVVYADGTIARGGDTVQHRVDLSELERCRELAQVARDTIGDIPVGMGSEADDIFFPFFICHTTDSEVPAEITADLVRDRFGGTIFPPATITVEPLEESGVWWEAVTDDLNEMEEEGEDYRSAWRRLIEWFNQSDQVHSPVFVQIGDREALWDAESEELPGGTEMTGSVLPRLAVGLTHQGSIVGILGYSVQT